MSDLPEVTQLASSTFAARVQAPKPSVTLLDRPTKTPQCVQESPDLRPLQTASRDDAKCTSFFRILCLSLAPIIYILYYFTLLPLNALNPSKRSLPEAEPQQGPHCGPSADPCVLARFPWHEVMGKSVCCLTAAYLPGKHHPGWKAQDQRHLAGQPRPPPPGPGSASGGSAGARPAVSPRRWGSAQSPPWPRVRLQGLRHRNAVLRAEIQRSPPQAPSRNHPRAAPTSSHSA